MRRADTPPALARVDQPQILRWLLKALAQTAPDNSPGGGNRAAEPRYYHWPRGTSGTASPDHRAQCEFASLQVAEQRRD